MSKNPKLILDKNTTEVIVAGVQNAISEGFGVPIKVENFKVYSKNDKPKNNDIIGVIKLSQKSPEGILTIRFSEDSVRYIIKEIYGDAVESMGNDILRDSVAEISNMVYGFVKSTLNNDYNYQLQMTIPDTITGKDFNFDISNGSKQMIIPITLNATDMVLDIMLQIIPEE